MKLKQPLSVLFWSSQNYSQYKKYECDHRFPSLLLPPSLLRFLSIFSPLIFLVLNFPALVSVYLVRHCKTFVLTLFQSLCSLAMFWRLDVHGKSYPPPWYKGRCGGGGWWNPSLVLMICCCISKIFCLYWKAFDLPYKTRYILSVVAMLEACDVTNYVRYLGRH